MTSLFRRPVAAFVPTVIMVLVVVVGGARLIDLSLEHRAAVARDAAAATVRSIGAKIAAPLDRLASFSILQAHSAAQALAGRDDGAGLASIRPAAMTFWMDLNDHVLRAAEAAEDAIPVAIASEWRSAETGHSVPASALLGPMRIGSHWLLAVRTPVDVAASTGAARRLGFAVSFADLDELLADVHLARLIDAGYDFELAQIEPRSSRPRVFLSTRNEPLTDAVIRRVDEPPAPGVTGSYIRLSIRPREGWVPQTLVASEIGMLAFVAWLIGFGTHDLLHALSRSRAVLAASRTRLHAVHERLASEIRQRLSLQESFDFANLHDTFTGLPNRRYFMEQLDRALRAVRTRERRRIAVLLIDIARLQLINQLLGHTAGDDLMAQVARRFEGCTANLEGALARWAGDQFALLLLDVDSPEAALEVATQLRERLRQPFQVRRHRLIVAATVGVSWVDSGQQRPDDVVREADIALAEARRQESTQTVLYSPNLSSESANLVSLEADLHVALEKHQLRLVFQPIVDLHSLKMVGAEALLRWHHPVEGVLRPDRFLRIAEDAGLMVPITRWVILKVIKLAAEWVARLPADHSFYISINLSPAALRDPDLSDYLATLLEEASLPPYMLKFELTELALLGDAAGARQSLNRLHDMGIQLMLDDFGTGYSSISSLQLFPFDVVKIDCPFVNRRGGDASNLNMIAGMVRIADSLDLTSIAEVVEGEMAASIVKRVGCRYAQGFYFSAPLEADAAYLRLKSQAPFEPSRAGAAATAGEMSDDPSSTMMLPILSIDEEGESSTSDTVFVRPLSEDGLADDDEADEDD